MATKKRRKLTLATSILLAAVNQGVLKADDFDDFLATQSPMYKTSSKQIGSPPTPSGQRPKQPVPYKEPSDLPNTNRTTAVRDIDIAPMLPPPLAQETQPSSSFMPAPKGRGKGDKAAEQKEGPSTATATAAPIANTVLNLSENSEAVPSHSNTTPQPAFTGRPAPVETGCNPRECKKCGTKRQRCHDCLQAKLIGYANEFYPLPLGQSVYAPFTVQVANGDAARMVLYHYDFEDGGEKLNYRGKDRVAKIAMLLGCNAAPVIVERSPTNPRLADARRLAVINEFAAQQVAIAPERVIVGVPTAIGLRGVEATLIHQNQLNQTMLRGAVGIGSGGGPFSATPIQGIGQTGVDASGSINAPR